MFNLSGSELLIIAVLGLVVLGPEKLPGAMKRVGKIYREIRSVSDNVQREVKKAMDEPLKQLKETKSTARDMFEGKTSHLATPNFRQGTSAAASPPTSTPPGGAAAETTSTGAAAETTSTGAAAEANSTGAAAETTSTSAKGSDPSTMSTTPATEH